MGLKTTYTCYKGKEMEDCCNARIREAVRNRTYFFALVLGIILMLMALVIKTSDNTIFVDKVSFASTITSIILSVIAIWMSITGERNTTEIKEKVNESVHRLIQTTDKSVELSNALQNVLESQNVWYEEIQNKMEEMLSNINIIKTSFDMFSDSKHEKSNSVAKTNKKYLDSNLLEKLVLDYLNGYSSDGYMYKLIKRGMKYIYERVEQKEKINVQDLFQFLIEAGELDADDKEACMYIIGIMSFFYKSGVFTMVSKDKFNL